MTDISDSPQPVADNPPVLNAPRVVVIIIGLMILIHGVREFAGEDILLWSLRMFSFIPAQLTGAFTEEWPLQRYWTFVTYAFLHGSWMHLLFNSLWLLIFGSYVARRLSLGRFLLLSLLCTVAAAAAMLVDHWNEVVPVIGASGTVSGYMAAAVPLMYGGNHSLGYALRGDVRGTAPLPFAQLLRNRGALIFIAIWLGITLMTGAAGFSEGIMGVGQDLQIAWEAHLGGFLAGLIGFYLLDRRG